MRELKALIDTTNTEATKYKLWTMMKEKNLGLITNKECLDTDTRDVTEEVAQNFWKDVEEDVVMTNVSKDDDNDKFDAEDLVSRLMLLDPFLLLTFSFIMIVGRHVLNKAIKIPFH